MAPVYAGSQRQRRFRQNVVDNPSREHPGVVATKRIERAPFRKRINAEIAGDAEDSHT
jgi:hypothetical protein